MTLVAGDLVVDLKGRRVLDGVGLAAEAGGVLGLIGPNGAGKSTLLRALAGLLPLVAGSIRDGERDVTRMPARERARRIAYLPQGREVRWAVPVATLVALGRLPHQAFGRAPSDADRRQVAAAMVAMDIAHLANRPATELSGGELARVLMARAIAQDTPVLIADEPAAGLDPAHQLGLFHMLAERAKAGGCVVVALHDLSLAARFCHKLLLLGAGRVIATGSPGEVLTPERLRQAYGVAGRLTEVDGIPTVVIERSLA